MAKMGRPVTRKIDDSVRPSAERGLPIGEIRYSTVYDKHQLSEVKKLAEKLSLKSEKPKKGNVPPVQFKDLIKEALTDLLLKYQTTLKPSLAFMEVRKKERDKGMYKGEELLKAFLNKQVQKK